MFFRAGIGITLYANPEDWIFPSTKMKGRTPLSASMMAKDKIRPAAIKVGLRLERGQRFGFHNFHHSLATFLVSRGKDVKTIQGLLRHLLPLICTLNPSTPPGLKRKKISPWRLQAPQQRISPITPKRIFVVPSSSHRPQGCSLHL